MNIVNGKVLMNVNDTVLVRLTPQGYARLVANHAEIFKDHPRPPEFRAPHQTPDGWSEFLLWDLMAQFGPHTHMGMTGQFFVNNEVRIPRVEKP